MWHVGQTLYRALLKLHNGEFAWSMGVCNYSIGLLDEVWGLVGGNNNSFPTLNQLEFSPFNANCNVVNYCNVYGIVIGCLAWSKLSHTNRLAESWAVLLTSPSCHSPNSTSPPGYPQRSYIEF